jgi:hypothetical protein
MTMNGHDCHSEAEEALFGEVLRCAQDDSLVKTSSGALFFTDVHGILRHATRQFLVLALR